MSSRSPSQQYRSVMTDWDRDHGNLRICAMLEHKSLREVGWKNIFDHNPTLGICADVWKLSLAEHDVWQYYLWLDSNYRTSRSAIRKKTQHLICAKIKCSADRFSNRNDQRWLNPKSIFAWSIWGGEAERTSVKNILEPAELTWGFQGSDNSRCLQQQIHNAVKEDFEIQKIKI